MILDCWVPAISSDKSPREEVKLSFRQSMDADPDGLPRFGCKVGVPIFWNIPMIEPQSSNSVFSVQEAQHATQSFALSPDPASSPRATRYRGVFVDD
jgi:hypothetical protein